MSWNLINCILTEGIKIGVTTMKLVVQRVSRAKVTVDGEITGAIDTGFVILVGVGQEDEPADADYLADKVINLRVFNDENGKMNLSLKDINGSILSVSQFTLLASTRKGRRPSFIRAAAPEKGEALYQYFNGKITEQNIHVEEGIFGAHMDVELVNDGPVTIILDSSDRHLPRK